MPTIDVQELLLPGQAQDADVAILSAGGASVPGSDELRDLVAQLTAGERHAECCICFDPLPERECAAFVRGRKRTCAHYFHEDCARELLGAARRACPLCRRPVDALVRLPDVAKDPHGWFRCMDVEGDGALSRAEVVGVLVCQFPVDQAKLEEALPGLWRQWDVDGSGFISRRDFIDPRRGLLQFVHRQLQREVSGAASRPLGASRRQGSHREPRDVGTGLV